MTSTHELRTQLFAAADHSMRVRAQRSLALALARYPCAAESTHAQVGSAALQQAACDDHESPPPRSLAPPARAPSPWPVAPMREGRRRMHPDAAASHACAARDLKLATADDLNLPVRLYMYMSPRRASFGAGSGDRTRARGIAIGARDGHGQTTAPTRVQCTSAATRSSSHPRANFKDTSSSYVHVHAYDPTQDKSRRYGRIRGRAGHQAGHGRRRGSRRCESSRSKQMLRIRRLEPTVRSRVIRSNDLRFHCVRKKVQTGRNTSENRTGVRACKEGMKIKRRAGGSRRQKKLRLVG